MRLSTSVAIFAVASSFTVSAALAGEALKFTLHCTWKSTQTTARNSDGRLVDRELQPGEKLLSFDLNGKISRYWDFDSSKWVALTVVTATTLGWEWGKSNTSQGTQRLSIDRRSGHYEFLWVYTVGDLGTVSLDHIGECEKVDWHAPTGPKTKF